MTDLTVLTPAEVDALYFEALGPAQRIEGLLRHERSSRRRHGSNVPDYLEQKIANYEAQLETELEKVAVFEAEYERRGGWNRFVVVPGGHLHKRHCSTLTPGRTLVGLVAEASGLDAGQVVGKYGEGACTHCFPEAPVLDRERVATEKREKRETEQRDREAEKKAKKYEQAKKLVARVEAWVEKSGVAQIDEMDYREVYDVVYGGKEAPQTVADVLLDDAREREDGKRWDPDPRKIVAEYEETHR